MGRRFLSSSLLCSYNDLLFTCLIPLGAFKGWCAVRTLQTRFWMPQTNSLLYMGVAMREKISIVLTLMFV